MKVVLISGKARHGKDTLAGMLKNHLEDEGYRVLIAHYGDLVKYVCEKFFDWDGNKDEAGRTLLQYVGTDIVRKQNEDFWANFIKDILTMFSHEWDYVLIPDTRFVNEVECFNGNFDSSLVRIYRPNYDSGLTPQQLSHPSETALDDYKYDCYVVNDGNLQDLKNKVPEILKTIGGLNAG